MALKGKGFYSYILFFVGCGDSASESGDGLLVRLVSFFLVFDEP